MLCNVYFVPIGSMYSLYIAAVQSRTACLSAVQPASLSYSLPPCRTTCLPAVQNACRTACLPYSRTACLPYSLPAVQPPCRTASLPSACPLSYSLYQYSLVRSVMGDAVLFYLLTRIRRKQQDSTLGSRSGIRVGQL